MDSSDHLRAFAHLNSAQRFSPQWARELMVCEATAPTACKASPLVAPPDTMAAAAPISPGQLHRSPVFACRPSANRRGPASAARARTRGGGGGGGRRGWEHLLRLNSPPAVSVLRQGEPASDGGSRPRVARCKAAARPLPAVTATDGF